MAQYVKDDFIRDSIPVGVLTTLIVPATSLKGYESAVVFLANPSGDTLTANVEVSPNGIDDWKVVPDDAFNPLGPSESNYLFVDGRFQYFRVRGTMGVGTESIFRSVFRHRGTARPG